MVNIGSLSTGGRVIAVKADLAKIALTTPVCTEVLEKIALSRRCILEIINRVWIVNLHFQDRQALEVDRLGSDQKRNPCETNGAGIDIHPYAAPLNISWGEKQFTPKSIHGAIGEPYNCLLECSNASDLSQIWPSRDSFELCCGSLCERELVTHTATVLEQHWTRFLQEQFC